MMHLEDTTYRVVDMTDFALAVNGIIKFQEIFNSPASESNNQARRKVQASQLLKLERKLFASPSTLVAVLDLFHSGKEIVSEHWNELPVNSRNQLKRALFTSSKYKSALVRETQIRRTKLRVLGLELSLWWASIKLGRDVRAELAEAVCSLQETVLEQIAQNPINEMEPEAHLSLQLKNGRSEQVAWADVSSYLEANADQIEFHSVPNQSPRRSRVS